MVCLLVDLRCVWHCYLFVGWADGLLLLLLLRLIMIFVWLLGCCWRFDFGFVFLIVGIVWSLLVWFCLLRFAVGVF